MADIQCFLALVCDVLFVFKNMKKDGMHATDIQKKVRLKEILRIEVSTSRNGVKKFFKQSDWLLSIKRNHTSTNGN